MDTSSILPRYLITTSDEQSWKFDRPVIFMGEWCRLHSRSHIWKAINGIVAEPYGVTPEEKYRNHLYARNIENQLLDELVIVLNRHHGIKWSKRSWQILLGMWLRQYVNMLFNRFNTLEKIFHNYSISGMARHEKEAYTLATKDTENATLAYSDSEWNLALTSRLLDLKGLDDFMFDYIQPNRHMFFVDDSCDSRISIKEIVKRVVYAASKFGHFFVKESDAFICNTYLSKIREAYLQLMLGQFPQIWKSNALIKEDIPKSDLRRKLTNELITSPSYCFEDIVRVLAFELIPVVYLEGFMAMQEFVNRKPWPKNPKFIFTSYSVVTDEPFKMYTAQKVQFGSKYIVGQHGGGYWAHWELHSNIDELTCDKFLTWGWRGNLFQHVSAFMPKKKMHPLDKNGGLLLVNNSLFPRLSTWDVTHEHALYFEGQQAFVTALSNKIQKKLVIRLHRDYKITGWDDAVRWSELDKNLNVDLGETSFGQLISTSRLIVFSYDSTGILQALANNIPMIAFFPDGLNHLHDNAKDAYGLLIDAGIVYLTADSAAKKINQIWNNIESWWGSNHIQEARIKFSREFANTSNNEMRDILTILQSGMHYQINPS
jgi:putative transferase (TIGR04331 family)